MLRPSPSLELPLRCLQGEDSYLRTAVQSHIGADHTHAPVGVELHSAYLIAPEGVFPPKIGELWRPKERDDHLPAVRVPRYLQVKPVGSCALVGKIRLVRQ